jgi:hypothetical protein
MRLAAARRIGVSPARLATAQLPYKCDGARDVRVVNDR